jgi:hypothetical protein
MNYKRLYKQIVENAKQRNSSRNDGYFESHHIVPDFMFINRSRKGPAGHLPGNPNDKRIGRNLTDHFTTHYQNN